MKRLQFLITSLAIVIVMTSCSKDITSDGDLAKLKSKAVLNTAVNVASDPVSDNGVVPYIIPGVNKGGNRTCAEVEAAFNTSFSICRDKLNYEDFNNDGCPEFDGSFIEGLNVIVEGNYISFDMTDCIAVDDKFFKVGAVIVKGSNNANVYYYPKGTISDGGLAAPGGEHMVSNLTFCFIECEEVRESIVAVKLFYNAGQNYTVLPGGGSWAASEGEIIFTSTTDWCKYLGINKYPEVNTFQILRRPYGLNPGNPPVRESIGTATVWTEDNYMYVSVIINPGGILTRTYLYIGDYAGIYGSGACPTYTTSWIFDGEDTEMVMLRDNEKVIFRVPY